MQYVCCYPYDVHQHKQPQDQNTLNNWRLAWTCTDQSTHSPQKENSNDCGIFALVSLALLSNGARLQRDSYSQNIIYTRQTRQRIPYLIWSSGLDLPTTPWSKTPTPPHTAGEPTRTRTCRMAAITSKRPGRKQKEQ